jgi:hypothetical protein
MKVQEDTREKSQIEREHLDRISEQDAAEAEALKNSRIVKGVDTKNYKKFKKGRHIHAPKQKMSDRMKLKVMRRCQLLAGFIGFAGLGVIFWSIKGTRLYSLVFEDFSIEIDSILLGCTLTLMGIVGIIGFQYKHDKISDKIHAEQHLYRHPNGKHLTAIT